MAIDQSTAATRIVRTYMTLSGLYILAASLIWGVNTLFLLDAGLSISEVFLVSAVFSAGMVIFELPTGVVADTLGRRVSYLLSVAVLAVTTALYLAIAVTGGGVVEFAVVSVLMGLGFTFYSGALDAWLVDALNVTGEQTHLDHVFARSQQVTGAAMLVGATTGGFLGQVDLMVPFAVRVVLLAALFVVSARLMHEIGFSPRPLKFADIPRAMADQARAGVTYGWQRPGLRALMVSGMVQASFVGWGFYAAQPYFLELLERDAVWVVGVVTALLSLSTMAGNEVVELLGRKCRRRTTLLMWSAITAAVAIVVVGVSSSFWVAVPAFMVFAAALGVSAPVRQAYVHEVIPAEHRATVISFDAMVGSIGGVGGQLGLGRLADVRSFGAAYIVGGLVTVAALPALYFVRRTGGPEDVFVGSAARPGTCAAVGLPSATQVDSAPQPATTVG